MIVNSDNDIYIESRNHRKTHKTFLEKRRKQQPTGEIYTL